MKIISFIADVVWGPELIILLIAVGVIATIASGGFQFVHFGHIMKNTFGKVIHGSKKTNASQEDSEGQLKPFQAISMAIGGAVGTGNIGGVATAVATGGPGAVLWMLLISLLGMITKMFEVTMAVYYRKVDSNGEFYGGPTYYMGQGLGKERGHKWWIIPAVIFGIGIYSTVVFTMTTYNVADAMSSTVGFGSLKVWGWIFAISTFIVIVGGMKSLARVAEKLVPFMCLFYVISALVIIALNITSLPAALLTIVKCAFTPTAAVGGFLGSTVAQALTIGMKRALYSNEAGWGTSPMIHASAKTDHPIKQGMWGAFEVFVDTCVVCTLTGLVIVVTGVWDSGLAGAALTLSAFESALGPAARWIIAVSIYLFAFTTVGGWWVYNEVLLRQIIDVKSKLYNVILWFIKLIYPLAGLIWVYIVVAQPELASGEIWIVADIGSGVPTFANLFTLLFMFGTFRKLLKDYKARYMGIGEIDPNFKLFYNDEGAPVLKNK